MKHGSAITLCSLSWAAITYAQTADRSHSQNAVGSKTMAIIAGRLIDPVAGSIASDQIILVRDGNMGVSSNGTENLHKA